MHSITNKDLAITKILTAKFSRDLSLNLCGLGITNIPPEIGELDHVRSLQLGDSKSASMSGVNPNDYLKNRIAELPKELFNLRNLESLEICNSDLTEIPEEISLLANLERLDLSYNQLSSVPPKLGKLNNLIELDLSHNNIKKLPPELNQLQNLRLLVLDNNLLPIPLKSSKKTMNQKQYLIITLQLLSKREDLSMK